MNCREFRRKHDAYIDDTLSGVELDAMARHRERCERCARLHTRVRRALLLAHNLPTIELSKGFGERLQLRLTHERALTSTSQEFRDALSSGRRRPLSVGAYTALAAGILAVAGLATTMSVMGGEQRTIRLAPVVASLPEPEPSTLATPAMVASMPAGMPVWPAVFVAQQAPWHLASDALQP
jgi:anti-sigma factor RsiW